ncbi:MAG: RNA-directed DNA polymerase [Eubacteriales bacterium]|nr:RNA-directed DNA polymerase [Eubacteriales bacterium]
MTNKEQICARIERDKARRAARREQRARGTWIETERVTISEVNESLKHPNVCYAAKKFRRMNAKISVEERLRRIRAAGDFRSVITIQNLNASLEKRRKGVEWKGNVQKYLGHAVLKNKKAKDSLWNGKLDVDTRIRNLKVVERGKRRDVQAVMIDSRVIQGCICDASLIPLCYDGLVYDNMASMEGRGVDRARKRMECHLQRMIRQCGNDFYVIKTDFTKFFDSIPHDQCRKYMKKQGADGWIRGLSMKFIRMYHEAKAAGTAMPGVGLSLGSQISQDMAVFAPSNVDHIVKDTLGIHGYIRYMDDCIVLCHTKDEAHMVLETMQRTSAEVGLQFNPKKTTIVKASRGFEFLKIRYRVQLSGRIVKTLAKSGIKRMRRKLKAFAKMLNAGVITKQVAFDSFASWLGNVRYAHSYQTRKNMLRYYNSLFGRYKTEGVYA